jgi:energy-coupling factor transporter ATP-binding protein EcfA2
LPIASSNPISALHEILKWSKAIPLWQRDALRRIVTAGIIQESDLQDLNRLCRSIHGADQSTALLNPAEPLSDSHLPPPPTAHSSVSLVSIAKLQRVNRLPADQVLTFGGEPGLTVIYGDNGSGKSGYARVIKRACRTRGTSLPIKANAFELDTGVPASAQITYDTAGQTLAVSWTDGVASDPLLASVFVFDASTAENYLGEDGPAVFTPRGLDVLPKLAKACDAIHRLIQDDINLIANEIQIVANNWKFLPTTEVGRFISELSANTSIGEMKVLSSLTQQQLLRLGELNDALKSDPIQKAKETRASARRLRSFASMVEALSKALSDPAIATLHALFEAAQSTAAAARAFASGQFDSTFLLGTGGESWRILWEAARDYSIAEPYKGHAFPNTEPDAKCVLCQRPLDEDAAQRLRNFEAFCKDNSQQRAEAAAKQLSTAATTINTLKEISPEATTIEADLAVATSDEMAIITEFAETADLLLATIKENLVKRAWSAPQPLPVSPVSKLTALADELDQRAIMEESAQNPAVRTTLTAERDELAAREWLAGVQMQVGEQISRFKRLAALESCLGDTETTETTLKSKQLTKLIVTDAFCRRFEQEAKDLGVRTIRVKMEEIRGQKGESRFGVRVQGAGRHKVSDIASEGEQRSIALAAFLAELSQASHKSTLVFDDPVSSLDHWHREKIAVRLVNEAISRQVIVFTHDTVFLHELQEQATRATIDKTFLHIEWHGGMPGQCMDGLPWDWKSVGERIDKLEKFRRDIEATSNANLNADDVRKIRLAYSWLRATIERIIEKEVFADVAFRFRTYINLKNLEHVVGFSQAECDEINRLHKRCCDITEAHDPALGQHATVATPAELGTDLAATKALVEMIKSRRKQIDQKRKATVGSAV